MDKETVLEIIGIIDKRIHTLEGWHHESLEQDGYDNIYIYQMGVLIDLKHRIKDHTIIRDEDKEMGL